MSDAVPRRKPPSKDDFLILLVEDNEDLRGDARRALDKIDGVYVVEAADVDRAHELIERHYIDAAVVDLDLQGVRSAGFEVLEKLRQRSGNAPVIIWSNYLGNSETVEKFVDRKQVIRTVDKEQRFEQVTKQLRPLVERWQGRKVKIVDEAGVAKMLWKRRENESYELRAAQRELGRELERVYRRLFGSVRGLEDDAEVTVTLRQIEREGLSAAVTVKGEVTIGHDAGGEPVHGNRCVVKIGPIKEVEQEVERYERFVKFGVRMAQRVELLAYAPENLVGGIAYSFAGGVFGHSLISFDELLKRPDGWPLAREAINRLFDPRGKDWYGVHCKVMSPRDYMDDTYRTDFKECFDELINSLQGLQRKFGEGGISLTPPDAESPGTFSCPGGKLTIPPRNVSGSNAISPERLACLVHGDMHGGNVMVELGSKRAPGTVAEEVELDRAELKRICLIDYRSAGPGPRAVDAAAMQATIRLADAAALAKKHAPDGSGDERHRLKGDSLRAAIVEAANRVRGEEEWLEMAWQAEPDGVSVARDESQPWAVASSHLTARMRYTFSDMPQEEYLPIAILSALRQFGYGVGPLVRVRILAWLSALYSAPALQTKH